MSDISEVRYRDRRTGEIVTELLIQPTLQRWIFGNALVFRLFNFLLNNTLFCWVYGKLQTRPVSAKKIPVFLQQYRINTDEFEHPPEYYTSFNAFFIRRLKSNARPFHPDPDIFCSPADGKVLVYPDLMSDTAIPVKGGSVSLADLLNTDHHPYTGGSALIVRLAPYDYHRFHFPTRGTAGPASTIPGRYYVVNPLSLARLPDLFGRNKRAITEITTEHFGTIAYLEIGGFAVASIVQTYTPGPIDRGQEKGYFQFGGSTLILLFESGTITFDSDLIQDSEQDIEVQVQAGTQIGTRS